MLVRLFKFFILLITLFFTRINGNELSSFSQVDSLRCQEFNNIKQKTISQLPVNSVTELLKLQPGFTYDRYAGILSYLGYEVNQSSVLYDNLLLQDPRDNSPILNVPLSSILCIAVNPNSMNVVNANAISGIFQMLPLEGDYHQYRGNLNVYLSPPAPKHFGASIYDKNSYYLRPFTDDDVCWAGTYKSDWDIYTQQQYPSFDGWNALSERLLMDENPDNNFTPSQLRLWYLWAHRQKDRFDQPDIVVDGGFGGPAPWFGKYLGNMRFYSSYRGERERLLYPTSYDNYQNHCWTFRINSDISRNTRFNVDYILNSEITLFENFTLNRIQTDYQLAELAAKEDAVFSNAYFSAGKIISQSINITLSHEFSDKAEQSFSISTVKRSYPTGPATIRDTTRKYEIWEDFYVDEAPMGYRPLWMGEDPNIIYNVLPYFIGSMVRDSSCTGSIYLNWRLDWQIFPSHKVRTGFGFYKYKLNFNSGVLQHLASTPSQFSYRFNAQYRPYRADVFIEDVFHYQNFIARIGLRYDLSCSNTDWANTKPFDRDFISSQYSPENDYPIIISKTLTAVSPRLELSYNVGKLSTIHFKYGHYQQLANYETMLQHVRDYNHFLQYYGNPNLSPIRSKVATAGYSLSLLDLIQLKCELFTRNTSHLPTNTTYTSIRGIVYNKVTDYGNSYIKGLTVSIIKHNGAWWTGFVHYLHLVETAWYRKGLEVYQDPSHQYTYDKNFTGLKKTNRPPVSRLTANLELNTPLLWGPKLRGVNPFGGWSTGALFQLEPKEYITYNPNYAPNVFQNAQMPTYHDLTLTLSKIMALNEQISLQYFCNIYNALNVKRLSMVSFSDRYDYIDYMNSLHLPESAAWNNIPGTDRVGDFREDNVPYQPILSITEISPSQAGVEGVIFYECASKAYFEYKGEQWIEVEQQRMRKILREKAYIDMPNISSFSFLNPRRWELGMRINFNI